MSWLTDIETEFGIIKVDINHVLGKIASYVQLADHEFNAFLQWGASHSAAIAADLQAATPIISAVGAFAATAATGNPAAGAIVTSSIASINSALAGAEQAVKAINDAYNASQASKATGNTALVNDTAALAAGLSTLTNARASVTNVTTAALNASKAIQAFVAPGVPVAPSAAS